MNESGGLGRSGLSDDSREDEWSAQSERHAVIRCPCLYDCMWLSAGKVVVQKIEDEEDEAGDEPKSAGIYI